MMNKTMEGVKRLADQELNMANEQYPLFASNHEGIAVIREELEEAEDDMESMFRYFKQMWGQVKADIDISENQEHIKDDYVFALGGSAIHCACECIQVAAMCEKIKLK